MSARSRTVSLINTNDSKITLPGFQNSRDSFGREGKKQKKNKKLCSPLHFEGTSDLFSSPLTGILDCSAMDDSAPSARYLKPKKACFSRRGKRMTMQGHYSIF